MAEHIGVQLRIPVTFLGEANRLYTVMVTPERYEELKEMAKAKKSPPPGVLDWMPED